MNTVSKGHASPINRGGLREDWGASNQQYFIPVDRQTYENWTQQLKQGIELSTKIFGRKTYTRYAINCYCNYIFSFITFIACIMQFMNKLLRIFDVVVKFYGYKVSNCANVKWQISLSNNDKVRNSFLFWMIIVYTK